MYPHRNLKSVATPSQTPCGLCKRPAVRICAAADGAVALCRYHFERAKRLALVTWTGPLESEVRRKDGKSTLTVRQLTTRLR